MGSLWNANIICLLHISSKTRNQLLRMALFPWYLCSSLLSTDPQKHLHAFGPCSCPCLEYPPHHLYLAGSYASFKTCSGYNPLGRLSISWRTDTNACNVRLNEGGSYRFHASTELTLRHNPGSVCKSGSESTIVVQRVSISPYPQGTGVNKSLISHSVHSR